MTGAQPSHQFSTLHSMSAAVQVLDVPGDSVDEPAAISTERATVAATAAAAAAALAPRAALPGQPAGYHRPPYLPSVHAHVGLQIMPTATSTAGQRGDTLVGRVPQFLQQGTVQHGGAGQEYGVVKRQMSCHSFYTLSGWHSGRRGSLAATAALAGEC